MKDKSKKKDKKEKRRKSVSFADENENGVEEEESYLLPPFPDEEEEGEEEVLASTPLNGKRKGSYGGDGRFGNTSVIRRVREVDLTDVPEHLFTHLVKLGAGGPGVDVVLPAEEVESSQMEGWIFQCPKTVNLSEVLQGKKIKLSGGLSVVTSEDEEIPFEVDPIPRTEEDPDESVLLVLPGGGRGFKVASIPLCGQVMVKQSIQDVEAPHVTIPRKKKRRLPQGIKERHPIYGVDFSQCSKVVTRSRSPSKKKDKKRKQDYEESVPLFSFSKRQKKSSPSKFAAEEVVVIDDEESSPRKRKVPKKSKSKRAGS